MELHGIYQETNDVHRRGYIFNVHLWIRGDSLDLRAF